MFEDIYYWTKNGRPDVESNHIRNQYGSYMLRHLNKNQVLIKTYHVDLNDDIWTENFHEKMDRTIFQQDLVPYVNYSLNKKRRWEINGDRETLSEIQNHNSYRDLDMDVLVINRVWLRISPYLTFLAAQDYYHYFFLKFPIRQLYQLNADQSSTCIINNSTFGQSYKSLLPQNRSPKISENLKKEGYSIPKIAYHIITPPRNYEFLLDKRYRPGKGCRFIDNHRTLAHRRRVNNWKDVLLLVRYENFEDDGERVDADDELSGISSYEAAPSKFYMLEDHVIRTNKKINYKNDVSTDSSSWSIVE
ncbi:Glycosyltransferase family 92 protein [Caenorhabditis elegans]|uniref:Glycosyltransferase family 92 protein n=1 Tax=Caenorhabditis elegans TaxID=6239 RepID=B1GRK2_CAEEL|nr:Glycosyltransferase family 92 protein [Caenorhabditis elegans]CCD67694.2 Glycosyltransferase family 92 protein [Caenorhabditis elegans]|eukprot:NP_001317739.1 Uncharacterized protein CELE_C49G7.7 [Caenorhabditis elegans]